MQPKQFIHIPCPADVPEEPQYAWQRRFNGIDGEDGHRPASGLQVNSGSYTYADVFRDADRDSAELTITVNSQHGSAKATATFTPFELRDLAQRLLDAAHDIEAYPPARRPRKKMVEVPA